MTDRNANQSMIEATRQSLAAFHVQKQSIELEAEAIISELTTPPHKDVAPMGIDTPLVDNEGYPRSDIDIYRARSLRGRLAELKTDHKALLKDIDRLLVQLAALKNSDKAEEEKQEYASRLAPKPKPKFDPVTGKWVVSNWDGTVAGVPGGEQRSFESLDSNVSSSTNQSNTRGDENEFGDRGDSQTIQSSTAASLSQLTIQAAPRIPFARVNAVAPSSPAAEAGLREDDLITAFGDVTVQTTPDALQAIGALVPVQAANNQSIAITVLRGDETLQLTLSPRPWSGRGLIGCHVVPYSS